MLSVVGCEVIPEGSELIEVFTPADSSAYKRTSLLIEYSGWRCVNCPNAAAVAHGLQEQYGEELVVVVMHPETNPNTRYGTNQAVNYTCPEADSVYLSMGGSNTTPFPTGNVNMLKGSGEGSGYFYSDDMWATLISQAARDVMRVGIRNEVTLKEGEIEVEVTVENSTEAGIEAKLMVWLTEDGVVGKQKMPDNTTNDEYIHNHLLRGSITPVHGEQHNLAAGEEKQCKYRYSLPARVVAEKSNVVSVLMVNGVVVQAKETRIVTQ